MPPCSSSLSMACREPFTVLRKHRPDFVCSSAIESAKGEALLLAAAVPAEAQGIKEEPHAARCAIREEACCSDPAREATPSQDA